LHSSEGFVVACLSNNAGPSKTEGSGKREEAGDDRDPKIVIDFSARSLIHFNKKKEAE
jgi:hypothetical protein